jgi:hypothetical protein
MRCLPGSALVAGVSPRIRVAREGEEIPSMIRDLILWLAGVPIALIVLLHLIGAIG